MHEALCYYIHGYLGIYNARSRPTTSISFTMASRLYFKKVAESVSGFLEFGKNATEGLLEVGGKLLEKAPEAIDKSTQLAKGIIKATNETRPFVEKVRPILYCAVLHAYVHGRYCSSVIQRMRLPFLAC